MGVPYGSEPTTCPVRALDAWAQQARLRDGPLFRPVNRGGRMGPAAIAAAVDPIVH